MFIFNWFRRKDKRRDPDMTTQDKQDVIDLGTPKQMVGHTGFTRGAGGGRCQKCGNVVSTLMPDHKCAHCSTQSFFGPPMPGDDDADKRNSR